jgi:hypothetical protein
VPSGVNFGCSAWPSSEICRSPRRSCTQMLLCFTPTAVTYERPSGANAIPSSSVGPELICSGCPSGKRCRQV